MTQEDWMKKTDERLSAIEKIVYYHRNRDLPLDVVIDKLTDFLDINIYYKPESEENPKKSA